MVIHKQGLCLKASLAARADCSRQPTCCLVRTRPQLELYQNSSSKMLLPELPWCSWRATPHSLRTAVNTNPLTWLKAIVWLSPEHAYIQQLFLFFLSSIIMYFYWIMLNKLKKKIQYVKQSVTEIALLLLLKKCFVPSYLLAIHGKFAISWLILHHSFLNKLINLCIYFIYLQDRAENQGNGALFLCLLQELNALQLRFTLQLVPFLKQRNKPKNLNESLSIGQEEAVFLDFQFCAFMIRQKHDLGPENEVNWCMQRKNACELVQTEKRLRLSHTTWKMPFY